MLLIRAWAYGLRTISRCSMPGSFTSSMKLPRPRTSRGSSLRFIEWPRPLTSGIFTSRFGRHGVGRHLHGLDDVDVAGAAAQVARDAPADLVLARVRVVLEQGDRAEHHAWRAEPALQAVLVDKGGLHRVQRA